MPEFSKKYHSFFDWLNTKTNFNKPYTKRIIHGYNLNPDATLAELRGHKQITENMFRSTIGTGISDKNRHFSLTIYAFKDSKFDTWDIKKMENILAEEFLRFFYPKKHYKVNDFQSWNYFIREERNQEIELDKNYLNKWFFEIDGDLKSDGIL
jgi:hypothetical protein